MVNILDASRCRARRREGGKGGREQGERPFLAAERRERGV